MGLEPTVFGRILFRKPTRYFLGSVLIFIVGDEAVRTHYATKPKGCQCVHQTSQVTGYKIYIDLINSHSSLVKLLLALLQTPLSSPAAEGDESQKTGGGRRRVKGVRRCSQRTYLCTYRGGIDLIYPYTYNGSVELIYSTMKTTKIKKRKTETEAAYCWEHQTYPGENSGVHEHVASNWSTWGKKLLNAKCIRTMHGFGSICI